MNYYTLPLVVVALGSRIKTVFNAIKAKENISMEVVLFIIVLSLSVFVLLYP
ncbi:MAG: hypothetical protein H6Q25_641 [Bacteroidetes bacterium]|nr:hypothetical protein [Bacteroidota bacterium]